MRTFISKMRILSLLVNGLITEAITELYFEITYYDYFDLLFQPEALSEAIV